MSGWQRELEVPVAGVGTELRGRKGFRDRLDDYGAVTLRQGGHGM